VSSARISAQATLIVITIAAGVALALSTVELVALGLAQRQGPERLVGLESAARLSPLNWTYRYELGALLARSGLAEAAEPWFRSSLALNPARAEIAIGLAEATATRGSDARPWIERAIHYGRSETAIRVRTGTLYARLGDHERAASEFAAAALGQKSGLRDFFSLLHSIYPDWFVLEKLVSDDVLGAYFSFAKSRLMPLSMRRIWARYEQLGTSDEARQAYVEYLLRHGLARDAWNLAFGNDAPPLGTVLNGSFEEHGEFSRFGWRFVDGEGVKARVRDCTTCSDRGRALSLKFDGATNGHYFGTSQTVPVKRATTYRLSARVMGDGITSARGPALAVAGMKGEEGDSAQACELWVVGEELKRTFRWRPTSLMFGVPEACDGVRVMVVRPRTRRLDKFIGGELWLDDVVLEEISSPAEEPSSDAPDQGGAPSLPGVGAQRLDGDETEIGDVSHDERPRAFVDELFHVARHERLGARESITQARGPSSGGMSIARHGVVLAGLEERFSAPACTLSPQTEK